MPFSFAVSVSEARQLMPLTTSTMSDEEVEILVSSLELLALALIKMVQSKELDSE